MQLSEIKAGNWAVVERVGGSGALRRRILEMGIVKGTRIFVEKYAPLKDPLELIVKGAHVSLRVAEAAHITVSSPALEALAHDR
ncbi:MAG: FeoA family protein [Desulfatitalea sp.]|nr:FeoA domain-containing protein [Desulfatitalea sp.]NNK02030.1 FeoA family protein [Desulfatitalea sp.]